jgi:CheY-like chemotaxis protein
MLLDLHMPVMDGFDVLAAIKGRTRFQCLPIIVLSSVDDPLFIQQALKFGATDFLIKPLTMEERIEMVRGLHSRWFRDSEDPVVGAGSSTHGPSRFRRTSQVSRNESATRDARPL